MAVGWGRRTLVAELCPLLEECWYARPHRTNNLTNPFQRRIGELTMAIDERTRLDRQDPALRSCESKLLALIRNRWALEFGTRRVGLIIEYQDRIPVLIRIVENSITEEKLK
jgi:hypothetical protein